MTGQHARRYSRIREWRRAKAAALYVSRHRRLRTLDELSDFVRSIA